ncbi:hypothetical protein VP01_1242g1 [Puccinia sorghi]|uniref:chitin deacetylase n=1 Tax=Puccinia sorghi TaxID=27349 RepID=A0A0L6VR31_9BASI|nr:hypothetical protein VP01_1242g1 [Puccinia sorghi]
MTMIVLTALACTLRLLGSPSYGSLASSAGLRDHRGRIEHFSYPPEDVPGPKPLSAWVKQYERAKSQGLIPSIRPSVLNNGEPEYPSYSQSTISNPKNICSWTVSGCYSPDDIVTAPHGAMGISFDDGPQKPTAELLSFLKRNNQSATHFMIGSRIHERPRLLLKTVNKNHDHIAVHTWSRESLHLAVLIPHQHKRSISLKHLTDACEHSITNQTRPRCETDMTTMTDKQVLGEIGWTMQIIYDLTGLVPAFWRPPYGLSHPNSNFFMVGDVDNRVRAISRHVFGLKTVMWSTDPNDWCLSDQSSPGSDCTPGSGPQNIHQLIHDLKHRIHHGVSGSRFPKHGIISLEHELSFRTVESFIKTYPLAKSLGWNTRPIPDLFGLKWYQQPVHNSNRTGILPQLNQSPYINHTALNNITNLLQGDVLAHRNESAAVNHSHQINSSLAIIPAKNDGYRLHSSRILVSLSSFISFPLVYIFPLHLDILTSLHSLVW